MKILRRLKNSLLGGFILTWLFAVNCAQAQVWVNIDIDQAAHHLAQVTMTFSPDDAEQTEFSLPTWRTGRYQILNLANGIRQFSARDGQGNVLAWKKIDKSTWRVKQTKDKTVQISYQVYANQLGDRTRHIDDSHAFLDNSTVLMYSEKSREQKHTINLSVPPTWRSFSGLEIGDNPHQFMAKNYDVLADSPIETGINEYHQFEVDGREYGLVIWGQGNYNSKKMAADLKVLVQQSKHIWQGYPFSRYVFMVHATSGVRGATEHVNSTIIQRSRYKFSDRKDYLGFILTAAHEFVHTWNVKQYRPEGIVPYDYQQENYSNLLWLAEGSTSYLQSQLLMRGDLISSQEFLEKLAKRITGFQRKPGRNSQTVAQASFDAWLNEGGDYANNHSVNIYSEGFLVSWLLDFDILTKTDLKQSYRNVHNQLYQQFRLPKSYNEQDVVAILAQITGEDYSRWWQENVHGFAKPNFEALLAKAGLAMSYSSKGGVSTDKQKAWTGLSVKNQAKGMVVSAVEKNSPAWQAGITTDDIIIAVDGLRLENNKFNDRLKDFKAGQVVDFTLFRRDMLLTKPIKFGAIAKEKLKIVPMKNATRKQQAFFTAWTGLNFPQ